MERPESKISLLNFDALRISEKLDYTYFEGVFLSERKVLGYIIEIYALNNFFVEVWYGGLQDGETPYVKIKSFRSIELLEPYLYIESSFQMLKDVNY
jgi:hypothetical protein